MENTSGLSSLQKYLIHLQAKFHAGAETLAKYLPMGATKIAKELRRAEEVIKEGPGNSFVDRQPSPDPLARRYQI